MAKSRNMDVELTIHQMIECYCETEPHHIAIIDGGSSYCYGELNQKANQLAHYLCHLKFQPDTIIAISIDPSPQLFIGILAILKAGCGYLPLEASHPKERLEYILEDTKAPLLITQSQSKEKYKGYAGRILFIDQIWNEIQSQPLTNPLTSVKPTHLAYVIYTSGSTGKPKGVLVEHKSVVNYIRWFADYSAYRIQDRIDYSSSIIFDMAVTTTLAALALGLQIVICQPELKKNVSQYINFLKTQKINMIKITPSYFKIMTQEATHRVNELPDLNSIILGGEILLSKDCLAWLNRYPNHVLFNEYGPTETTVAVTAFKITHENMNQLGIIVPIGKPGANIETLLLNQHNDPIIQSDEIGKLYIGGACLARGYLNQNELTAKSFINHSGHQNTFSRFYKTGDLCRYLPDGNIEFLKRIDEQIKINGYRIELSEIETCLAAHHQVKETRVIARENTWGEKQLIAYYIPQDINLPPNHQELRFYLQQKLADYMTPSLFVMVKSFPLTENGKLNKHALPEPSCEKKLTAPRNALEQQLIEIWKKAFHLQKISINSHFFELGGHSLIAARIILEIEKAFAKTIRLEDLYKAPTISELALIIKNTKKSKPTISSSNSAHKKTTIFPLSDFQFMIWLTNLFEPKMKKLNIISRRRMSGRIDIETLSFALKEVVKKHEILSCQIAKYSPALYLKKDLNIKIIETHLTDYSEQEVDFKLSASIQELTNNTMGLKNKPLIEVRLFHLNNEKSELQIGVSHMGFDDASEELLLSEISTFYLNYKNGYPSRSFTRHPQYQDYVLHERNHFNQHLERDITFWEQYLHDTELIAIPETEVIKNMDNHAYSSYFTLANETVDHAYKICTTASVSIMDLFCASVTLALKNVAGDMNNKIYMNIARSVRDRDIYENMIGCFLRLDPIKVDLKTQHDLVNLAKSIQQSRIDTDPYQSCSGMVKLACLEKSHRKKIFKNGIVKILSNIYCKIFREFKIDPKLLMMYGRLTPLRTKNQFLININLLNNFITPSQDTSLFGLKLEKIKTHDHDIWKIDNVIEICLLKNKNQDAINLVVSGNLNASFREKIGNEIIKMISHT